MKKTILVTITILLIVSFTCGSALADESDLHIHDASQRMTCTDIGCVDLNVIEGNLSEEQLNQFRIYLTGESQIEPMGLTCILFGHTLVYQATIIGLSHQVYTTQPRCVENTYQFYSCSRCSYDEYDLVYTRRVVCCS